MIRLLHIHTDLTGFVTKTNLGKIINVSLNNVPLPKPDALSVFQLMLELYAIFKPGVPNLSLTMYPFSISTD